MDQARAQYQGFWFVCRYCQRVFRDKLELFCHHVNDHPEYREEINGQRNIPVATHEMIYTDARPTEVKRNNSFVQPQNSSAGTQSQQHTAATTPAWYPPTAGHIPNHHVENQNYYGNPVEYYVVVPNSNQSNQTTTAAVNSNTGNVLSAGNVVNLPIVNQQLAHSSSSLAAVSSMIHDQSHHHPQQHHQQQQPQHHFNNVVTLRNDISNDWSKVTSNGGDSSDNDTQGGSSKDDLDYYCWKCKVKFGNATAYIAHSSSCFPPVPTASTTGIPAPNNSSCDSFQTSSCSQDSETHDRFTGRKRGRKGQQQGQQQDPKRRRSEPEEYASTSSSASSFSGSKGKRKNVAEFNNSASSADASRPLNGSEKSSRAGQHDRNNFSCKTCGLKFSSNNSLVSHMTGCKSQKNPYETYQYKCIKCSQSFDVYLQYKRHIEIHTGAVRYS